MAGTEAESAALPESKDHSPCQSPRAPTDEPPLATYSMITVRLSDPAPQSSSPTNLSTPTLNIITEADLFGSPTRKSVPTDTPCTEFEDIEDPAPQSSSPTNLSTPTLNIITEADLFGLPTRKSVTSDTPCTEFEDIEDDIDDLENMKTIEDAEIAEVTETVETIEDLSELASPSIRTVVDDGENGPILDDELQQKALHLRRNSSATENSEDDCDIDWDDVEKTEEKEPRDEGSDEVSVYVSI